MPRVYYVGGPCNGQHADYLFQALIPQRTTCDGYDYSYDGGDRFYAVGVVGGDIGPVPGQRQVYLNWTRLMRAMAVTVPHHVRQSAKARARIRRIVK